MADINVGAISEALNNKADRDLNNTDVQTRLDNKANTTYVNEQLATKAKTDLSNIPSAYDYVVKTYKNGSTWYRQYKSGWVEQGSQTEGSSVTVTLAVPMADTLYNITVAAYDMHSPDDKKYNTVQWRNKTTTSVQFQSAYNGELYNSLILWSVCGYKA